MSKNKWKQEILNRFKGRGKTWYKSTLDNSVSKKVEDFLKDKEGKDHYLGKAKELGFYWICFQNIKGTENDYNYMFEVRYKGSNENHRKDVIFINEKEFNILIPLNSTPKKAGIEGNHKKSISKESKEKPRLTRRNLDRKTITKSKKSVEEAVSIKPCIPASKVFLPLKDDFYFFREFLVKEGAI